MSEFNGITGFDGWNAKLKSLLEEARQIAQQDDLDERLKMSDRLTDFILESRPDTPEIKELDRIANETATALLKQSIDDRLNAIIGRTGDYKRLTKEFKTQAKQNEDNAESIRLNSIMQTVDSATAMIDSAKKLKVSLKKNVGENKVAALIDETIAAIENLRSRIGKLL
ncbi:MAG TPA: hypothetical protein VMX36_11590 [Sedimentisphaerales bacterium]|nr:hypothetical protein [Sedimentisphaerales bacterium]